MHGGHNKGGATDQRRSARCAFTLCHNTSSNVSRVDYWRATDAFATGCDKAIYSGVLSSTWIHIAAVITATIFKAVNGRFIVVLCCGPSRVLHA